MNYPRCSTLLKGYFSNITYIDDMFDLSLVNEPIEEFMEKEEGEIDGIPLTDLDFNDREQYSGMSDEIDLTLEEAEYAKLSTLLLRLGAEEKYDGIQLSPIKYKEDVDNEFIIRKMLRAPLSIIDWDLRGGKNAFAIVPKLFKKSKQLKVVVVYTDSFQDAKKALDENQEFSDYNKVQCDKKNLYCLQNEHKSLMILAYKKDYNLESLLNVIVELYITCCGLMSSALLSVVEQMNEQSGRLFESFCKPFEDVYFLQLFFSQVNNEDRQNSLNEFLLSKVQSEINVSSEIIKEMQQYEQDSLFKRVNISNKDSEEYFKTCIDAILPYLQLDLHKEMCAMLKDKPYEEIKCYFDKMKGNYNSWDEALKELNKLLKPIFRELCNQHYTLEFLGPHAMLEQPLEKKREFEAHKKKSIDNIKQNWQNDYDSFKNEIWPVLIQVLISGPGILQSSSELVNTMKYYNYEEKTLIQLMPDGIVPKLRDEILLNRIHFGDILLKQQREGDFECLLCITPSCDVYRTKKVDHIISFLNGKIIKPDELHKARKENMHVSVLPYISEMGNSSLNYVAWRFYDIKNFDLKKDAEYKEFVTYNRPFRLNEKYMRQISNKFLSYFSRAGVDEVFMKQEKSLMKMFL